MFTKYRLLTVFCLVFVLHSLQAQSPAANAVLAAESRRFEAMTHADTAALRPMLADDLLYVHSNALKETKAAHLASIGAKKLVYEKMVRESAGVRLYGKTALVNGVLNVKGILNGNAFELHLLYTAVYRKSHHQWRLVSWQSTKIS